jgi:hypothetical protein
MLKVATDQRCSCSLAECRDRLSITDVLDLADTLDFWDDLARKEP